MSKDDTMIKTGFSRKAIREVLAPSMYSKMLVYPYAGCACSSCVRGNLKTLARDLRDGYYDSYCEPFTVLDMSMVDGGIHCDHCDTLVSDYE